MKFYKFTQLALALSTFLGMSMFGGELHAAGKSCHRGFIVFAGQDAKGKVVFVMENTQSRGDKWDWTQASQAAWLYDENSGWVKLKNPYGKPFQKNSGKRIGGEWQYQFAAGYQPKMSVHSDENDLHLSVLADQVALKSKSRNAQMVIANGAGSLTWKDRKLTGKVYMRDDLHLGMGSSDLYFANAKGSHREAFHVGVGESGIMSMVRTNAKDFVPLAGEMNLSLLLDSVSALAENLQVEATAWKRLGFYEFPTEWQGTFSIEGRQAMFKLISQDFQTTEYLLLAGTRIAGARGFLCFDGETYPLFGVTEVEGRLEGRKQIEEAQWRTRPAAITPGKTWEATVR
ncbi:MAG: hypothetical protein IPN95_30025 [Bacteroidetes bacterium]|nr:hypothetical protein [Bacteroidota bacterium]MBP6639671.1 hypothetical protein [Bacteroidia bacterium]MBP6720877.1 hypothetical protein [Bacteroidia bacterium]MBP8073260.1 hypothetical protein [Bacteroidia bacterium]